MKKLKGFTLLELIIVMFLIAILMGSIMMFFRPIKTVYEDTSFYEKQRTTQNGIVQYISENIRYASAMSIDNRSSSIESAIDQFFGFGSLCGFGNVGDIFEIQVLIVDNETPHSYNNYNDYRGRIYRTSRDVQIASRIVGPSGYQYTVTHDGSPSPTRLAMGEAFYGELNFSINLDVIANPDVIRWDIKDASSYIPVPADPINDPLDTINITVSSSHEVRNRNTRRQNTDTILVGDEGIVTSRGSVTLSALSAYQTNLFNSPNYPRTCLSSTSFERKIYTDDYVGGTSTGMGEKTFIVYYVPTEQELRGH